jgi:tripartite-type tricarboxylate transporter receptor subunit TctC
MVAGGHLHLASVLGRLGLLTEQRKMKVIGVMADSRDPRLPDVPTLKKRL